MSRPPSNIIECPDARSALKTLCGGLCDPADPRLHCEKCDPADMPPAMRKLLVHHDHMTTALQDHYGRPVELRVLLGKHLAGSQYTRTILLTLQGTDRVVEYGIARIDLRFADETVRAEILSQRRPLGDILVQHGVLRRIEPKWYVRITSGCPWLDHFGPGAAAEAYGRLGIIYCNHEPAIELLEVIAEVGPGVGRL